MLPNETILIGGKEITYCEFQIIPLALKEFSRKQMAAELNKSEDTIDSQMRHLYKKIDVKSIGGLCAWAIDNGFDRQGNYTPKNKPSRTGKKKPSKKLSKKK